LPPQQAYKKSQYCNFIYQAAYKSDIYARGGTGWNKSTINGSKNQRRKADEHYQPEILQSSSSIDGR